ncbi:MAG: hypothetical protein JXQ72_02045 [Anaerolineae bacterium]|nr:hypothetical protein [Anaerolineae bacterium]
MDHEAILEYVYHVSDYLQHYQEHNPAVFAIIFSIAAVAFAMPLVTREFPGIIKVGFFMLIAVIAAVLWWDVRKENNYQQWTEHNACLDVYHIDRDGNELVACLDNFYQGQSSPSNSRQINLSFFLNIMTECTVQAMYLLILLFFIELPRSVGWEPVIPGILVAIAIFCALFVTTQPDFSDVFLNISTEFVGAAVAFMVTEHILSS